MTASVSFVDVSFGYDRWGVRTPVLDGFTIDLPDTGWVLVAGANGSGKSTILKLIAGQLRPDRGAVRVAGRDPFELSARRRRRLIAFSRQDVAEGTVTTLTVREHVVAFGYGWAQFRARLASVDRRGALAFLADRADTPVDLLSGGQRQILALTLRLLNSPPILLLDEPLSAIDPARAAALHEIFGEIAASRLVLHVSHDVAAVEGMADYVLEVSGGRGKIIPAGGCHVG